MAACADLLVWSNNHVHCFLAQLSVSYSNAIVARFGRGWCFSGFLLFYKRYELSARMGGMYTATLLSGFVSGFLASGLIIWNAAHLTIHLSCRMAHADDLFYWGIPSSLADCKWLNRVMSRQASCASRWTKQRAVS